MEGRNVSMLLPLYDKEKSEHLKETLAGIFRQAAMPKEIVLVYDGPINEELQVVVTYFQQKDPHLLTVVKLEKNQGLEIALAIGLKHTKNHLVARMDTDDIMEPRRLEKQLKIFQKDPEIAIVGSNTEKFTGTLDNVIGKRIVPEYNNTIRVFSKRRDPFDYMIVVFDKKAILEAGNYQPLNGFENYYLWARLLGAGYKGYNIQEILVYTRTGKDMYAKRGGMKYLSSGLMGRYRIWEDGLGSVKDFIIVSCGHIFISLLPNQLRGKFYQTQLRR